MALKIIYTSIVKARRSGLVQTIVPIDIYNIVLLALYIKFGNLVLQLKLTVEAS